ncbi:unnamed protein product [Eruca vesicaria subsp. sativa]|uniref:Uncharacterized protein n=1 Tax=Eruca vesicaria subsp. sativa TaxID=29727 RepID=A0ABC8KLN3_ERUVS|nr:unnamed protein product [Eruca vesicaria subsp. sativa]
MSPPTFIVLEDGLTTNKWSKDEWQRHSVFPGENPNPNFNFLVKNHLTVSPVLSCPYVKDESFKMILPLEMPPSRDNAVPLPVLPEPMMKPGKKLGLQETMLSLGKARFPMKNFIYDNEEDFKCNAFCLPLTSFGKQKHVRSPKSSDESSVKKKMMIKAPSFPSSTISLSASFEKFECGSWLSTTALARENSRLYFDLPVEMIKCGRGGGGEDVQEPVSLGFLFDKETENLPLRSVLKTSRSERQQRGSAETSPHRRVRFSTTNSVSCPASPRSCMTPRLLKARDDFNTFLAAQNA